MPVIHLDREYWQSGWIEPSREVWKATVARLIAGERWILDGNFGGSMELRLQAYDTVVFLNMPRLNCIRRLFMRWLRHRGSARPYMTPGCNEKLSLDFLLWIWTYRTHRRPAVLARLEALRADQTAVVLRSGADVERFLALQRE